MVDLLLESTEGDAKAEVEVIYSQYEATFAADELIGPPGEVEDAAEEGAADGGAVLNGRCCGGGRCAGGRRGGGGPRGGGCAARPRQLPPPW